MMRHDRILDLDPLIHAPIRLAVMSLLLTVKEADFSFIRDSVGTSDGNLSTHLSRLEKSGYISVRKTFQGKRPRTFCSLTDTGRTHFLRYLDRLEEIVKGQKQERKKNEE